MRRKIESALVAEGRSVAAVATGAAALDYLSENRVDLLILDDQLSDMGAEILLQQLRDRDCGSTFIVISSNGNAAVAVEMMKQGARDYLLINDTFLSVLPPLVQNLLQEVDNQRRLDEAQRALRVTERRYLALSQISPVGIFYADIDGRLLEVNDCWCQMSGLNRHEALGDGWARAVYPDDLPALLAVWRETVVLQNPGEAEWRFLHADGRVVWVCANAVPERTSTGLVTGFVGALTDITLRKQAELALATSEQLNRQIVESMPGGLLQVDRTGRIVRANAETARATGIPLEVLQTLSIDHFTENSVDEHGNTITDSIVDRCLNTGQAQSGELLGLRFPDGRTQWGLVNTAPLFDPQTGEVSGVLLTFLDVSQRKQIEEALARSEAQLRALVEHLPFDVFALDGNGRYTMQNATTLEHWGQLIGRTPAEVGVPPEILAIWETNNRRAMAGEIIRGEVEFRINGELHTFYNVLAAIHGKDGPEGVVGVNIDITDRKQAEERARLHLNELAHVTRLATMGEMTSELAHEINQPLYAIVNYAEASLRKLQPLHGAEIEQARDWLRKIAEQARRSGEIVRNLSRFVRKTPPKREPIEVAQLIRDVVRLLEFDLRQESVLLRKRIDPDLPTILADAVQIQQVLVNLVRNAVEASADNPRNRREVIVAACRVDASHLEIAVIDSGHGASPEQLRKLFDPFYTTKANGLGMGLAISQSLISEHGGRLTAEANADRGLTFRVLLPVAIENVIEAQ